MRYPSNIKYAASPYRRVDEHLQMPKEEWTVRVTQWLVHMPFTSVWLEFHLSHMRDECYQFDSKVYSGYSVSSCRNIGTIPDGPTKKNSVEVVALSSTQPKTPQTWCKLWIGLAWCNLPTSCFKPDDFIKLHQVCKCQTWCNLTFADLPKGDETTCIKPACSSQLAASLLTTCNRLATCAFLAVYNYIEIVIRLTKQILLIVIMNKINHSKNLLWTICAILPRNSDHFISKREVSEQSSCMAVLLSPGIKTLKLGNQFESWFSYT